MKSKIVPILFFACLLACWLPFVSSPIALVAGLLFAHFLKNPFPDQTAKATKQLLKVAVVGLGFGLNLQTAISASQNGIGLVVSSIFLTLLGGLLIGKLLKVENKLAQLISVGTAICGGSAIAAFSPVIDADNSDISVSLGVVFLLNSLALLIFPVLGHFFSLSPQDFGMWVAVAIHDTSSVVGAAQTFSDESLKIATTLKLVRALWIIPLVLLSVLVAKFYTKDKGIATKNQNLDEEKEKSKKPTSKINIPYFIGFFVIAILINTYIPLVSQFSPQIVWVSKKLLVTTLFLIGLSLSIEKIRKVGWRPLALGVILWVLISVGSFLVIV
ncbi:YeiH family protein [Bernardetia sp.]|uniref:YeiH family protein n=1 Tax=Bernardetia sp. TaxID=1937974 RepID=UPI0025BF5B94|nr:putative sulfate exporter family transporter [Bernardetia sp.]